MENQLKWEDKSWKMKNRLKTVREDYWKPDWKRI